MIGAHLERVLAKPVVGRTRCPRRELGSGHFRRGSILKGLYYSAQGCEPRATLRVRRAGANNPEGVASLVRCAIPPVIRHLSVRSPRVARPSQPWAGGSNPFGIVARLSVPSSRALDLSE